MGYTKDLWTRPEKRTDATIERVRNARWGKGKRWLACWRDPEGNERSRAFATFKAAERYWKGQETDVERGEYVDPAAGRVRFGDLAARWLASRVTDPSTGIRYESVYRLHVKDVFARRSVKAIKPSEIQQWLSALQDEYGPSLAATAYLIVRGTLGMAVADDAIKKNPAESHIIAKPRNNYARKVTAWTDEQMTAVIDRHPDEFRLIPIIGAGTGAREGEIFAVALEDFDFAERVLHIRRQVKKLGKDHVFALPKNDRERTVPLPDWVAASVRAHIARAKPRPYTLPWEKPAGRPTTHNLLFRWNDDRHIRSRSYSEQVWKPVLSAVGIIPPATTDEHGRRRFVTDRKNGTHAMRHFYASVTLADGVSIKELAEFLGHHDPGFTLRLYTHMLPTSYERARAAIDARMFRPRAVRDGTGTEHGGSR